MLVLHSSFNEMLQGEVGKVLVMVSWFTLVLVAMEQPIIEFPYLLVSSFRLGLIFLVAEVLYILAMRWTSSSSVFRRRI